MKAFKLFLLVLSTLFLSSCAKFEDGTSTWAEGAWLLFWVPFIGSLFFLYGAYKDAKLGKVERLIDSTKFRFFFVVLQLVAWAFVIYFNFFNV